MKTQLNIHGPQSKLNLTVNTWGKINPNASPELPGNAGRVGSKWRMIHPSQ